MSQLILPDVEYKRDHQQRFRRELEVEFLDIANKINAARMHSDLVSALSFHRNRLSFPQLGIGSVVGANLVDPDKVLKVARSIKFNDASVIKVKDAESQSLVFENKSDSSRDYITIDSTDSNNDKVIVNPYFSVLGSNDIIKDKQNRYRGEVDAGAAQRDNPWGFDQDLTDDPQLIHPVQFDYDFSGRSGDSTVVILWGNLSYCLEPDASFSLIHTDTSGTTTIGTDNSDKGYDVDITSNGGRVYDWSEGQVTTATQFLMFFSGQRFPSYGFGTKTDMPNEDNQTIKLQFSCAFDSIGVSYFYAFMTMWAVSFDLGVT